MKFTIDKVTLLKNLQLLSKAIPSRSTLPIISSALFTVKGNDLSLRATDLEISIIENQLIGKSHSINTLSKISQSIHKKNTKNVYQRILQKNTNENSTWFYLNKQAASVGKIAICSESDESPLGPIKVIIEANDIENGIQTLTD